MPLTRRWVKFPRLTLHRASGHPSNKLGCWTAPRLGSRFTQLVLSWSPCTVGFSWQLKLITQYKTPKCPMVGSAACNSTVLTHLVLGLFFKVYAFRSAVFYATGSPLVECGSSPRTDGLGRREAIIRIYGPWTIPKAPLGPPVSTLGNTVAPVLPGRLPLTAPSGLHNVQYGTERIHM